MFDFFRKKRKDKPVPVVVRTIEQLDPVDSDTDCRFSPKFINALAPNEVFVFGSNLEGFHGGGAARIALKRFGAVWGKGSGHYGQSYAIPTMQGGVETIRPYVDQFIEYAKVHTELVFLVTRIGCGIAGFDDSEIAPLFAEAADMKNVKLPKSFAEYLKIE